MRLIRAWDRFWFGALDPLPLGVFRVALGIMIFLMYLALGPTWEAYFGAEGISAGLPPDPLSVFYWTDGLVPLRAFWWLGVAASVTFTLGLWSRPSTIVLYVLETSMAHRSPIAVNGEDLLMRMLLFYACFAPVGSALSLDRHRLAGDPAPRIWPVRLMQINLALIYVFAAVAKLVSDPAWLGGDYMYWVLADDDLSRWPFPGLSARLWVSAPMTYAALLVEGLFPILVWFERTRGIAVVAAMAFQVAVALIVRGVTFFSLTMACSLLIFLPGEDLRAWAGRVLARRGSSRSREQRGRA